jgi:hypothetical protein
MVTNSTLLAEETTKAVPVMIDLLNTYDGFFIVLLTFIMLIIHIIFVMQNRRARKASEKPEIVAYIHPSKNDIHTVIDFTIVNCGSSAAYDIELSTTTPESELKSAGICAIGHDTLCNIPVVPKDGAITVFFGQATHFMNQDDLDKITYQISYKSSDGDLYTKEQAIPIKYLGNTMTVGNTPIRDIAKNTENISSQLVKLATEIKKFTK